MQAHRAEATITEDGVLPLRNVPFCRGDSVEVIVLPAVHKIDSAYTLRGKPVTLVAPTKPVAEVEWETLR